MGPNNRDTNPNAGLRSGPMSKANPGTAILTETLVPTTLERVPTLSWNDLGGAHERAITGRLILGTADGVDIVMEDPAVSRLHAEVDVRKDGLWVRDLGSRNGTYIEGIRVESGRVPEGGTLRVGATKLLVRPADGPTSIDLWPSNSYGPLLGGSLQMRRLFALMARINVHDTTVLLQGETGTGKELVVRALHDTSPRAGGPFIIVDCAALPESLLESELFGHTRGAFTGATSSRAGAIEAAAGGTLFLDEIGELPTSMQPKLLRVLESRTIRRLGENEPRKIDVRFVSATHRDLRRMVNEGTFREDLYFRLSVVPLQVPPLRERLDDLPLLMAEFSEGHPIEPALIEELKRRSWPGNVRELRNFVTRSRALGVEHTLALSRGESTDQPPALTPPPAVQVGDTTLASKPLQGAREEWNDAFEQAYLRALLEKHGDNVTAAARAAGVNRTYIHRLIQKHRI